MHTLRAPQSTGERAGERVCALILTTMHKQPGRWRPTNVHTYFEATNSNDDTVLVHTFFNYANFRHTQKHNNSYT